MQVSRRAEWIASVCLIGILGAAFAARNAPLISGDETGFLAIGRYLGGKGIYAMLDQPYYPFGYASLLAPGFLLFDDPQWTYRFAITLNVLLTGITVPLSLRLLAHFGFGRSITVLACSIIAATWPSYTVHISLAWAETLFRVLFLLYLLALINAVETGRIIWFVGVALLTAALYATHARALALIPLGLVFFAYSAVHRGKRAEALYGILVLMPAIVVVVAANGHFQDTLWESVRTEGALGEMFARLLSRDGIIKIFFTTLGHLWYQLVASFGFFLVGVWFLFKKVIAPPSSNERAIAISILGAIASIAVASVMQMSAHSRLDHLIYGRYLDAATMPLLLIGLVAVIDRVKGAIYVQAAAIAAILILGIIVYIYADNIELNLLFDINIAGIAGIQSILNPFIPDVEASVFIGISLISVMAILAIAALCQIRMALVGLAAYSIIATYSMFLFLMQAQNVFEVIVENDAQLLRSTGASQVFLLKSSWEDWYFFRERFILPDISVIPATDRGQVPAGSFMLAAKSENIPDASCIGLIGQSSALWQKGEMDLKIQLPMNQPLPAAKSSSWIGCTKGWSVLESWGRWTNGNSAVLLLPVGPSAKPLVLQMEVSAFTGHGLPQQRVSVKVQNGQTAEWVLTSQREVKEMPISAGLNTIVFSMPDAKSPEMIGTSTDSRVLGMSVSYFCITEQGRKCL